MFRKRYGSFRRFFSMLVKARMPYLWIIGYLVVSVLITNVGVSTTEYSAALFAGNVGLWTALAGLSALGIVGTAVVAYRKKKKEDNE